MDKNILFCSRNSLIWAVLLGLVLMLANTCSIRTLMTGAAVSIIQVGKSGDPVVKNDQGTRCALLVTDGQQQLKTSKFQQASLLLFLVGFIRTSLNGLSVRHTNSARGTEKSPRFTPLSVPLYIKNLSIIR